MDVLTYLLASSHAPTVAFLAGWLSAMLTGAAISGVKG